MLLELQRAFRDGILADSPDAGAPAAIGIADSGLPAAARLAIHRSNTLGSLSTALEAAFPVVARLVGDRFFRFAAKTFVIRNAPRQPQLSAYGSGFPGFLAAFPPAGSVPYLADVARLEWARSEAYFAADAGPLDPAPLSLLDDGAMEQLRFALHPATRLVRSAFPIGTIWQANQPENKTVPAITVRDGESVIVVRPRHAVGQRLISSGEFGLLAALADGMPLAEAAAAALRADPAFDLQSALATHFQIGTFSGAPAGPAKHGTRSGDYR